MKRRNFFKKSISATLVASLPVAVMSTSPVVFTPEGEYYIDKRWTGYRDTIVLVEVIGDSTIHVISSMSMGNIREEERLRRTEFLTYTNSLHMVKDLREGSPNHWGRETQIQRVTSAEYHILKTKIISQLDNFN